MGDIISIIAIVSLCVGSIGLFFGGLGLLRLGDVYQRMHGAGIIDTGGAGLVLFGLLLASPDWTVSVRLVLIGLLLALTSPTATHAIARAAHFAGVKPQLTPNPSSKAPVPKKARTTKTGAAKTGAAKTGAKKPVSPTKKTSTKKPSTKKKAD